MNYWKHSLLSKKKFGGEADDYFAIHKFIDSSKLFYFDLRHRVLLHNTYGIDLCIQKFGDRIINSDSKTIMVRDVAAEHCREDLCGVVPTLSNWFKHAGEELDDIITPIETGNSTLREFALRPFLMSGLTSSLIITHSNFGIYLAKEMLGIDHALELAQYVKGLHINELLQHVKLRDRWQYTPDIKQLNDIENGHT